MGAAANPQAGVEGVAGTSSDVVLGVITTDDRGLVCSFSSNLRHLGLECSPEQVGRHWTELFPSFRRFPGRSGRGADEFIVMVESTRQALQVTRCPIAGGTPEQGHCFLVLRTLGQESALAGEGEPLAALSELAAGVAHEINNPLTTISGWMQIFSAEAGEDDPIREQFASIQEELDRIARIVTKLLTFAQRPEAEGAVLDVNELVHGVVAFLQYQMKDANVHVRVDLSQGLGRVAGSAGKLKQVFLNLMFNARQAMPEGGVLTVSTSSGAGEDTVEIRFADGGHGVSAEAREHLFDPYFTTRTDRGGTGLGLPVSREIVSEMGGEIELESTGEHGSTFLVRLPVPSGAEADGEEPGAAGASNGGGARW